MLTHALGDTPRALGSRINGRTIRSLFRRNSPGIWYDPQDLSTMYQDARGTLPVYRPGTGLVDPPVGLMLDKSEGLELGPELWDGNLVVSNSSAGATGSYNAVTGELSNGTVSTNSTYPRFIGTSGLMSQGVYYKISVKLSGNIGVLYGVNIFSITSSMTFASGGIPRSAFVDSGGEVSWIGMISPGDYPYSVRLQIVPASLNPWSGLFIESISIREIKGYHAYQTTTTARPTLSGRYNLLTATETLATQSVTAVATDYTLSFSGTGTITLSGTATGTYSAGTHTIPCTAGTLTCTVAGAVTRADLRVKRDGSSLPAYQSVTSANTYDTAGFPLYLRRDKVDDVLTCVAPAITGYQGMGSTGGAVLGPVIIPAGTYTPLSESATTGIPEITRYVAIDGTLTASEQAVVERYLSVPSSGVFAKTPVFSFGLTSVASFSFALRTKADTEPVLIDWGDGTQSTHAGTTDQTASHTYVVSGTYAVKVYGADQSVLTRFSTSAGGMSGTLSLPSGMTFFNCAGSNTLSGTLSLPSGMIDFRCTGSNTLSGYTPSVKASNQLRFNLLGLNTMSATDVDNILIDYDAAGGTWAGAKEITIQGNAENRTSVSDAAYASLATKLTTLDVD